jgi:hypothetical protein
MRAKCKSLYRSRNTRGEHDRIALVGTEQSGPCAFLQFEESACCTVPHSKGSPENFGL